ncbi:copalyl diphosphate synthase 1 isoform X2 [Cryptomeria japonica]|uniref:copalyl diphosphate synthase 1 isoform X2 n=1 Tax=Cryptomeria japonica TaxID=3369 RepID=UPI0027DA0B39|nr:copalyl diphosphate synthase 1 isoform X2 [Cryptomeria japonica]
MEQLGFHRLTHLQDFLIGNAGVQNFHPSGVLYLVVKDKIKQNASASMYIDEDIVRIRRLFSETKSRQTSVSAYDTAWVAMVPSLEDSQLPQFPQSLSWIMNHQLWDGSWGLPDLPYIKDRLSHTLACIIALRTWNTGIKNVEMGLRFIRENIGKIASEDQHDPIGFEIIFTAMLEEARGLGLDLPYGSSPIEQMLSKRYEILKRIEIDQMNDYDQSLIFIVEGIRSMVDWNKVLRHQSKDGSLFHSPSATACALMHTRKSNCLMYLKSMLETLGSGVPSVYPINVFTALSVVDRLESLGISRHFKCEIKQALDDVYRCWTENKIIEGISSTSDIINSSVSFRILRWNGYDVSPDVFVSFLQDGSFLVEKRGQAVTAMLNLYKSSQMMFPGERILEEAKYFSRNYLAKNEANIAMDDQNLVHKDLDKEVEYALAVPWLASLERLEHRRYIENDAFDDIWIGKTSYKIPCISSDSFLALAKNDFNICQAMQQKDLQELEKWCVDSKFGDLHYARQKLVYCYFSVASTLFSPEMSAARIVWTKNAVLTTVIDDFYDVGGSTEELQCFLEAVKRWDPAGINSLPDNVKILFSALYNTVNNIAQNACAFQGRDVSIHLREIWYRLVMSMMKEAEWAKTGYIPSMQEYLENGKTSIALEPIVLIALYFVGPKLSEQTIWHHEYSSLMELVNNCGRLLNDIQSYKREAKEGKLNYVTLFMKEYPVSTAENAIEKIRQTIYQSTQKLLRNLLQPSVLPHECKKLYWNMVRILQLFYLKTDGFTSPTEMLEHINMVIFDPIV